MLQDNLDVERLYTRVGALSIPDNLLGLRKSERQKQTTENVGKEFEQRQKFNPTIWVKEQLLATNTYGCGFLYPEQLANT